MSENNDNLQWEDIGNTEWQDISDTDENLAWQPIQQVEQQPQIQTQPQPGTDIPSSEIPKELVRTTGSVLQDIGKAGQISGADVVTGALVPGLGPAVNIPFVSDFAKEKLGKYVKPVTDKIFGGIGRAGEAVQEAAGPPKVDTTLSGENWKDLLTDKDFYGMVAAQSVPYLMATLAGTAAGGPAGGLVTAGALAGGSAAREYEETMKSRGKEPDPEMSKKLFLGVGAVSAPLEYLPIKKAMDRVPGANSFFRRLVSQAIAEGTTEIAQESVNSLAAYVGYDDPLDQRDFYNIIQSGLGGVLMGGGLGGVYEGRGKQEVVESDAVKRAGEMVISGVGKEKTGNKLDTFMTAVVDELRPIQKLTKEAEKITGKKLKAQEDPFTLAWLNRGWARKAEQFIKWGTFQYNPDGPEGVEFTGKGLVDILKPVEREGNLEHLDRYLAAKRILNDERQRSKYEESGELGVWEDVVNELGPKYENVAQELYNYSDQLLTYLTDSGRISQESADAMRQNNSFYAPLYRIMGQDPATGGVSKNKFTPLYNPIKRMKGSTRQIHSPTESIAYNTYALMNIADRNRVGSALADLSEIEGMENVLERVPLPLQKQKTTIQEGIREIAREQGRTTAELKQDLDLDAESMDKVINAFRPIVRTGRNEIVVYRDGSPEIYKVDRDLYKAMSGLDSDSLGIAQKILSYPAKWLRAGATLTPEFMARNPIRDQVTAFNYSKYGYKPLIDLTKGIFSILSARSPMVRGTPLIGKRAFDLYQRYNASGAAHAALVSLDRNYLSKNLKNEMAERGKHIKYLFKHPLEFAQILSELTEEGTRVGEFSNALKKEGRGLSGTLEAGKEARDITLDFSRIGAKTKAWNMITAFFNAQIQGVDKMRRAFTERPVQTTAKAILANTIPSLLLYEAQKDDPYFQELPEWRRVMFYNWVFHNPDGSHKFTMSIPRPFELGILFGSVPEMILQWAEKEDPDLAREAFKSLVESFTPGILPTAAVPILENVTNHSFFFDRPIEPHGKEDLSQAKRYKPTTSETAKLVGRGMAEVPVLDKYASPAKIENLIRGYTGGMGKYALDGIDMFLKSSGLVDVPPEPSMDVADLPLIRGFTQRYPSQSVRSIEQFYREYGRLRTEHEDKREKLGIRGMSKLGAPKLKRSAKYRMFDKTAKKLSLERKRVQLVYQNKDMTPEEKKKVLDRIYKRMINMARARLGKEKIK